MPRKKKKAGSGGEPVARPSIDRRALERTLWDIERLVNAGEFNSFDELNAFLQALSGPGQLPAPEPSTPLERAQEVMYQAWGAQGPRRVELARQALALSEDCADAYVLLAEEEAQSAEEARELYERGVRAGERAIGPEHFQEWAGHFWGVIETRPYMRARAGLASILWHLGQREQAVAHYQEMLRLNPGDNQGLRYVLASCLLELGEDEALGELLDYYGDEPTADWQYTRALWLFRRQGTGTEADTALDRALTTNPFVVFYLLGVKQLPNRLPDYVGVGDESEAIAYVADNAQAWYETEGALEWFVGVFQAKMAMGDLGAEPG